MLTVAFRAQSGGSHSPPRPTMQPRGRSRVVSPVALARQASEERRQSRTPPHPNAGCFSSAIPPPNSLLLQLDKPTTDDVVIIPVVDSPPSTLNSHPISPSKTSLDQPNSSSSSSTSPDISPLPSDPYDSPPSPPQSLEDQVQVAYALDDIRLAKILLLKLKGVHVTSDSDPRIDQVRDEDFDMCFAPSGPLTLEEADTRAVQETQRKQRQWWHESQRAQRLRACEQIWEDEKKRFRDERLCAIRRREEEAAREEERRRLAVKQLRELTSRERQQRSRARVETYVVTKRDEDPFQYTFMPPTRASTSTLPCRSPKAKKTHPRSPGSQNRSVSFKEVINSMNGKLFPLDSSERTDDARRITGLNIVGGSSCHRRKASVRAELLDSLLQVDEWQEGERRSAKGKEVERGQQTLKSAVHPPTPMPSVPASVSVTSLSSSASPSRSSSWLSFGSWRSYATDITTPDSPIMSSPTSPQHCILPTVQEQHDLHPRCSFVRISVEESPLCPPPSTPRHQPPPDDRPRCDTGSNFGSEAVSSASMRLAIVQRVTRSVATIVEAAKGLQSAYITATIFAAGPSQGHYATSSQPHGSRCQRQARPEGYRALAEEVKKFTATPISINQTTEPIHFIPLVAPESKTVSPPKPSSAPKSAIIFPSPLRPRTPPTALAYRMRPVANPAVLRLKALQNLMCARGKEWEGRAREGGLGCGKERMLGIAFEGRGRSGLGCEVRFVVA